LNIAREFSPSERCVLFPGPCMGLFASLPVSSVRLVVTSPFYNMGKKHEQTMTMEHWAAEQLAVIQECALALVPGGSLCWQVGNAVRKGEVIPLDVIVYPLAKKVGLVLRNRIVWHFGHGLHCSKRFSGRYETILWFTKGDGYVFNLDPVRVPQKYPGKKHFKGAKIGQLSCNPLGKNPGDTWLIPNVKSNHVEKTAHPCQFPVELVERLVLALSNPDEWVLDPFLGSGTTAIAALMHGRRAVGAETVPEYVEIARSRIADAERGTLRVRPMGRPVFEPGAGVSVPPRTVRIAQEET